MLADVTITNEQINSLPLLVGIMEEMGIRELIDQHVTPHGHWQGSSVGTTLTIWLSHLLLERDDRLVMVRDWAADRAQTINALLAITLRDTDCTDDRLANLLTMLGDTDTQAGRHDEVMGYQAILHVAHRDLNLRRWRTRTALWWFITAEYAAQGLPSRVAVPPVAAVPVP